MGMWSSHGWCQYFRSTIVSWSFVGTEKTMSASKFRIKTAIWQRKHSKPNLKTIHQKKNPTNPWEKNQIGPLGKKSLNSKTYNEFASEFEGAAFSTKCPLCIFCLKTKIKPCNNATFISGWLSTQGREYNEQQEHQTHHFNPNDCRN